MKGNLRKPAALLLSVLFAFLTLVPGGASTAFARAPEFIDIPVDITTPLPGCAAPVEYHQVGTLRLTLRFDDQGNLIREVDHYNIRMTVSNTQTGESISTPLMGNDFWDFYQDGSVINVSTGLTARYVIPGQGLVGHQVGRLVLRWESDTPPDEPEVMFEAGAHEPLNPVLCELLSN